MPPPKSTKKAPVVARPGRTLLALLLVLLAGLATMLLSGATSPRLGLDLAGGTSVTLLPRLTAGGEVSDPDVAFASWSKALALPTVVGLVIGRSLLFPPNDEPADIDDLKDRYLFIEALETAKCFEEGVIESAAAANIGSIMGIGFPALTGGAAQFMTGWQALDETGHGVGPIGLDAFLARADELAEAYGERFRPTAYLREMAAMGESFPA